MLVALVVAHSQRKLSKATTHGKRAAALTTHQSASPREDAPYVPSSDPYVPPDEPYVPPEVGPPLLRAAPGRGSASHSPYGSPRVAVCVSHHVHPSVMLISVMEPREASPVCPTSLALVRVRVLACRVAHFHSPSPHPHART